MSTPIIELCIQLLAARLETLLVANGYGSNNGLRTIRGRRAVNRDELPCVTISEGAHRFTASYGTHAVVADVLIESKQLSSDALTDAPIMLADIYRCLTNWNYSATNITGLNIESITPIYPDAGSNVLGVEARISISTRIAKGDPYTQPS